MLQTLTIRDFVIVDQLEIEFSSGFTVFSGETGAGKSILVDALAMTLGGRADANLVREGAQRAEVSAEYSVGNEAHQWLISQELDDQASVILRRTVDLAGRSKAWINGAPATLAQMRELGELLVDIHGQHAHQSLLRTASQRALVDAQAQLGPELKSLGERYRNWQRIKTQRETLEEDAKAFEADRERLQWQVELLATLAPIEGEWEVVQEEHQRLSHAASLIEGAQAALSSLSEADGSVGDTLGSVIHRVGHLASLDRTLLPVVEALENARIQAQDAVYTLNDYLARLDLDPARLAELEARIEALHSSARRFRVDPSALVTLQQEFVAELQSLESANDLPSLIKAEASARAEFDLAAAEVSRRRRASAAAMSAAITEAMQTLSMGGGRFEIAVANATPSASGVDAIEFLVAAHPGASLRPLAKVASGGELARISLAVSVIASTATSVPTLIFDEVDSGIGGAVAEVVGRLLRQLGQMRQVLCVTHLAQVAAQGNAHFAVGKVTEEGRTLSQVKSLSAATRVDEVARMLGGIEITPTTRKHARELLEMAP